MNKATRTLMKALLLVSLWLVNVIGVLFHIDTIITKAAVVICAVATIGLMLRYVGIRRKVRRILE